MKDASKRPSETSDLAEHARCESLPGKFADSAGRAVGRIDIHTRILVGQRGTTRHQSSPVTAVLRTCSSAISRSRGVPEVHLAVVCLGIEHVAAKTQRVLARIARGTVFGTRALHGLEQSRQAQVCHRVGLDVFAGFFNRVTRRDQFLPIGRVDTVETRRNSRRATDSEVHFAGAGGAHHLDDLAARRAADDGVVDQNDSLATQQLLDRIQLHLDTEVTDRLPRLDKGPPHVVVPNQSHLKWNTGLLRITDRGSDSRIRNRHDQVCLNARFIGQNTAHPVAAVLNGPAKNRTVGPREIHMFEDALGRGQGGPHLDGTKPAVLDDDHFARLNLTYVRGR